MRTASWVFFALAGLFLLSAIRTLTGGGMPEAEDNFGYMVGAFLPGVVSLIIGLHLRKKAAEREEAMDEDEAEDGEVEDGEVEDGEYWDRGAS